MTTLASPPTFGRRRDEPSAPEAAAPARRDGAAAQVPTRAAQAASADTSHAQLVELRGLCLARIDPAAVAGLAPEQLQPEIERLVSDIATGRRIQLNAREQRRLAAELVDDMLGLGPLESLLEDESIADIMVNGPNRIFIERRGKVEISEAHFRDTAHAVSICQRIASSVGRRVDESSPMADARLKDGSRVNIVLPPLALDGPYISIRKFARPAIDMAQLVEFGAMTGQIARILEIAGRARLNVIISGGTGSGKTTLMNAMSRMIDPGERIVTVEDAAELQLQQPHVVRLETRPASLEGKGEITARDLVRNALRMRPDRIIIGETRGSEAFDMLQAMNTGHDGSMSTVHANTSRDAMTRIENMVQMGNLGLSQLAIRQQIVSAVDLIVQVERHRDGGRRITQVTEVQGMEGEVVILNDIFHLEVTGLDPRGRLISRYVVSRARPGFQQRLVYFGLDRVWATTLETTS